MQLACGATFYICKAKVGSRYAAKKLSEDLFSHLRLDNRVAVADSIGRSILKVRSAPTRRMPSMTDI